MKRTLVAIILSLLLSAVANAEGNDFTNPPMESRPRVWWHWINGNITKDGIKKDLEWMHRIGIAGFHQFDAGGEMMNGIPPVVETVPYLSNKWKEAFSYSMFLADSLGLEAGIASAPGWSSTGGPWVKPEDGMKKLTWRTIEVTGGMKAIVQLPQPYRNIGKYLNCDPGTFAPVFDTIQKWYEDIAVVAIKLPDEDISLEDLGACVSSSGGEFTVRQLSNGDLYDGNELPLNSTGTHSWIQYSFPTPVTIRSLVYCAGETRSQWYNSNNDDILLCSDDGEAWREVCKIPSCKVPQITIDIPETTSRYFRMMIANPKPDMSYAAFGVPVVMPTGTRIHEWRLSQVYKVNHAEEKAGFATSNNLKIYITPESKSPIVQIINLTSLMKPDGTIVWDIPQGRWRIYRFGASLTGKMNHPAADNGTGLEVDKLDPEAFSRYLNSYLNLYRNASDGLMGERGIQYVLFDSYEAEQMTWTPEMTGEFKRINGYDLIRWLPALTGEIIESSERTEQFLFDWRTTIGELLATNYDHSNEIISKYGMKGRYTESHESSRAYLGDGMDMKRTAAVPMSAIWMTGLAGSVMYQADIRESASVAHIYGQNIVAGEAFTTNGMNGNAYGWYPGNMKETADIALMSGLNRFFIHESAHQPLDSLQPGMGLMIFGQWFNRHETWAEYAGYWLDYLARSCYMLQKGRAVADVLWYYGEDTNITAEFSQRLPDVPDCYSYDFVSPHALLNCINAEKGYAVTESGMSYRVIAIGGNTDIMSVPVLRKLHELVSEGVFLIGKEPYRMAGIRDDAAEFDLLVASIWHCGRTNVWTGSISEGLVKSGLTPDFVSSEKNVRFVHRSDGKRDIYWVCNFEKKALDTEIKLRDAKGIIHVLDPETGHRLSDVLKGSKLHLEAGQALFIVSDPDAEPIRENEQMKKDGIARMTKPWTVSFDSLDASEEEFIFESLESLSENEKPSIKYFSGTAIYRNDFRIKGRAKGLVIDLGDVGQMADIFINNEHVAFLWKSPYKVQWNGKLKAGKNRIEIKVVNLWVNRLIGDSAPDSEKNTYVLMPFYNSEANLLKSGLIGPVKLEILR